MMSLPSRPPLALLRRCARPSSLARALWLAVALLHAWLVMRRVALGELAGVLDILRGGLCLLGVGYASLKFWQVATIFDSAPRRALAFAMILLLGHWLIAAPSQSADPLRPSAAVTAILVVAPVLSLVLLSLGLRLWAGKARAPRRTLVSAPRFVLAHLPLAVARGEVAFFHRPPPFAA